MTNYKHKSLRETVLDWFQAHPDQSIRVEPLSGILGANSTRIADACGKLHSDGELIRCKVIVPSDERGTRSRANQFEYRLAAGKRVVVKPYTPAPVFRRTEIASSTTPAGGGANITGSRASDDLREDAHPDEGAAVVEAATQDSAPAEPASNEIPINGWAIINEICSAVGFPDYLHVNDLPYYIAGLKWASPEAKTEARTAPQILTRAAELMIERGKQYDKPEGERSMGRTVQAFNAITGRDLTEAEGWLLLQVLKDVRLWQRPGYHADSAEDNVAYAALKAEAKQEEAAA